MYTKNGARCRWYWQLLIGGKVLSSFLVHIRYMLVVKFDYGWNMSICIALGICQGVAWILWSQLRKHPARCATCSCTTLFFVATCRLLSSPEPVTLSCQGQTYSHSHVPLTTAKMLSHVCILSLTISTVSRDCGLCACPPLSY